MPQWISFPRVEGQSSRQAHCDLPEGSYEREMSKEGFFGPASQFYHRHPPTSWRRIDGPLLPRAFDTTELDSEQCHPWSAVSLLHNQYCHIRLWKVTRSASELARNADGDDLLFIHSGSAELFCDFGHLSVTEGDYLLIPRGTMWRLQHEQPLSVLMIEATGASLGLPEKALVGHHAIFDAAMLDTPHIDAAFIEQQSEQTHRLVVKRSGQLTTVHYPFNPLDALGWHGDLSVVRINWRDIRPLMSHRYHLPPSAHTTFVSERFAVCTFCPRPIETDPGALKVPFFHNNDDYDEVIFYHRGEFFSRDNIHPGMVTLHPCGLSHGPHPKALQTGLKGQRKATDEVAVMIDTRDPLTVAATAGEIEWAGYVNSWTE
ncbi:homogentisate 1,2-dioxygenase [Gammaproteobacteria bacterium 53_120_T64]|nr:homogentisate 1,2-dioxygenase [Gammaproteobacteria bacterium 53_120_T64]